MNILCALKIHDWQDTCRCRRCLLTRSTQHSWNGCVCTDCLTTRNEGHSWNGCVCTKCSTKRNEEHSWDGCICRNCALHRLRDHEWEGCRCKRCDSMRDQYHEWDGCKCKRCVYSRHEVKDGICQVCGADRKCSRCNGEGCTAEEYLGGSSDGGPWGQMMSIRCDQCSGTGLQPYDSQHRSV
jgi:hypothetical protein